MNEELQLTESGKIADESWRAISEHFPSVELGAHIVMPNHVHGIILIRADASAYINANPLLWDQDENPINIRG